ncbi:MAG: DNA gyrase C-terminal beta-propeller domain-containing protein, partial [Anaerolineae bacterium]
KRLLLYYLDHRRDVVRRRAAYELERARQRQHILDGLRTALANLDAVIATIRRSKDAASARGALMTDFDLSEVQARAILDMQLRRLAALERQNIEDEYQAVTARIEVLEALLADEGKILEAIRQELVEVRDKFADDRRTRIVPGEATDISEEQLVEEEDVLITVSQRGYVKRVPADTYRAQRRGGRGIIGAKTRGEDAILDNFVANTRDRLLFFTDRGRVFQLPAHYVPESSREAAGTPVVNLIQMDRDERVTVTLPAPDWQFEHGRYLVMATRLGRIKRTRLAEYDGVRPSGLIAVNLEDGDELRWVKITTGEDQIIMVTRRGKALRFRETDVRAMGRAAQGVRAIRLRPGDVVAAMDLVVPGADLFVVTTKGYGKRTPLEEYATRGRYTQGVLTLDPRRLEEVGEIAAARVVEDGNEIALISDHGITMKTTTESISRMGRATRGVRVMSLDKGHLVASFAYLTERQPPQSVEEAPPQSVAGERE